MYAEFEDPLNGLGTWECTWDYTLAESSYYFYHTKSYFRLNNCYKKLMTKNNIKNFGSEFYSS